MNLYARLPEVRQEASANSVAANDPQWLRALAGASDEVAAKCVRQFEARIGVDDRRPAAEPRERVRPSAVAAVRCRLDYLAEVVDGRAADLRDNAGGEH